MNENPKNVNNFMLGNEWNGFSFKDKEKKCLNENHVNPSQINEMDFFFENYNNKNNANILQFSNKCTSNSINGENEIHKKHNINRNNDTNFNKYLTNNVNNSLWGEFNESYNVIKNKKERNKTPIKKEVQNTGKLISSMNEISNTFDVQPNEEKLNHDSTFDLWEKFTEYELTGNDSSYDKKKKKKK